MHVRPSAIQRVTVSFTLVEWLRLPLFPVMVRVYVPVPVRVFVVTVRIELPGGTSDVGLKVHVLRDGQPLMLRLTELAKPFRAPRVVV